MEGPGKLDLLELLPGLQGGASAEARPALGVADRERNCIQETASTGLE